MTIERPSETPIVLEGLTLGDVYLAVGALSAFAGTLEREGYKETIGLSALREIKDKLQESGTNGSIEAGLSADELLDALAEVNDFSKIFRQKNN